MAAVTKRGKAASVAPVVPLKVVSSGSRAVPVNLAELNRWELSVALYVAPHAPRRDGELLDAAACAAEGVQRVGIDLIRQVGALAAYADQARDSQLANSLWPKESGEANLYNRGRVSDAINTARRLWAELHRLSLQEKATALAAWRSVRDEMLLDTREQWLAWCGEA